MDVLANIAYDMRIQVNVIEVVGIVVVELFSLIMKIILVDINYFVFFHHLTNGLRAVNHSLSNQAIIKVNYRGKR